MNLFGQLYAIMFAVGVACFLSNPLGFIKESERVIHAHAPKIVNGRFGIPKRERPSKPSQPNKAELK